MKFLNWHVKIAVVSAMVGASMELFMVKIGYCVKLFVVFQYSMSYRNQTFIINIHFYEIHNRPLGTILNILLHLMHFCKTLDLKKHIRVKHCLAEQCVYHFGQRKLMQLVEEAYHKKVSILPFHVQNNHNNSLYSKLRMMLHSMHTCQYSKEFPARNFLGGGEQLMVCIRYNRLK